MVNTFCSDADPNSLSDEVQPLVRIEIIEGFGAEQIRDIVEARNTSNQVKDQSLLELEKAFDGIKREIGQKPYAGLIAYKEYEIYEGSDGVVPKPIDVREIISILTAFDKDQFGDNAHPIMAYSQKAACLKRFGENPQSYQKLYPLLTDMLKLWDVIARDMPEWYRSAKQHQGQGARFGGLTGVTNKPIQLHFTDEIAEYAIPTAFRYPIFAAMRAFIEEVNGRYVWGKNLDPIDALGNGLGEQLTEVLTNNALEMRNPTKLGKTATVWDQCYKTAQIWYLKAGAV